MTAHLGAKVFLRKAAAAQRGIAAKAHQCASKCGEQLAEHCGPGSARNAHAQRHDEQDIQAHVAQRRNHQEDQRRFAVAQRAQEIGDDVVKDCRARAQQDQEKIGVGVVVDVLRGLHPIENRVRQQAACQRQHDGEKQRQQPRNPRAAPHPILVLCAEALPETNAEAAGEALDEAQHKIDDDAGGADGGQRVFAQRAADDHRIGQRIEQLEQIAAEHRQREAK